MNAGSVDGSATEPATAPLATYANGNWNSSTGVFVAAVGADMTAAVVGRFCSICLDADVAPVTNQWMVARITAVTAGTRTITVSASVRALLGTVVATGTTGRTLRVGGAWAGPSGASAFPVTLALQAVTNPAGDPARLNLKADQTYAMTAPLALSTSGSGPAMIHGYTAAFGDGGRATIDGGSAGASYGLVTGMNVTGGLWFDAIAFRRNGGTGTATGLNFTNSSTNLLFSRCVISGMAGHGLLTSGQAVLVECEVHGNNTSNNPLGAGVVTSTGGAVLLRCMVHDNAGSNTRGVRMTAATALVDCVVAGNGAQGVEVNGNGPVLLSGCDLYRNGGAGHDNANNHRGWVDNTNLVDNGTWGVAGGGGPVALRRCGFGTGTAANASGTLQSARVDDVGPVAYAPDATPWADPDAGDFSIVLEAARGTGRGAFTQAAAGFAGTVAYPDIGAGQSAGAAAAAAHLTDHAETALLAGTPHPATLWVKLHVGDPGETGTAHPAAHVARASFARTTPAGGTCANAGAVLFAGLAADEVITHVSLWDDDTTPEGPGLRLVESGAPWWYGPLTEPVAVTAGDGLRIPAGDLALTLD